MEEYLSKLNDAQRQAVLYTDGPQLVIAGAGSGKTRVLTYKIVHLLAHGYEPWRILALTFTNKAAREMRERIETLVGTGVASKLWMGTFHSIFSRMLRTHADRIGYKSSFTIYDAADSKSLVKLIIRDLGLDEKIYKPSTVLSAISWAKNALVSPERYLTDRDIQQADARSRRPATGEIYRIYRNRCVMACAMDFDDLLYYTNVLLRDSPDILRHYQEYFRYLLVDEYQDTNFAQHTIITRLTDTSGALCVVGDDAQSIYSFRGANIANILNLQKTYPSLRIFKLEQNYRSTKSIINAANSLIDKNNGQIRKQLFSENAVGHPIEVVQAYSDFEEGSLVANRIKQVKHTSGLPYSDFAILYRTNAQSRILEESLRKRDIPYRIYGGLSFYQRKEIKDAIAYFRLAINPNDDEALRRVINYPARGIGETTLAKVTRAAIDTGASMWQVITGTAGADLALNAGTRRRLNDFASLIDSFIQMNLNGDNADKLATSIIERTGLLSSLLTDHTPENISKRENLEELLSGVGQFVETAEEQGDGARSLADFMSEVSLATDQDTDDSADTPRVTLMTVHAAKGLEFSNVFIVGVEEELFPSAMSSSTAREIEEERRLLYVAITRAKEFCMMSYASSRYRNGATCTCSPSRFLSDIDPRYINQVTGTNIAGRHGIDTAFDTYRSTAMASRYQRQPFRQSATQRQSPALRTIGGPAQSHTANATTEAPTPGNFTTHRAADLTIGMTVAHRTFGRGVISEIDTHSTDHRITVNFDNTGEKRLLLKFARLEIIKQ